MNLMSDLPQNKVKLFNLACNSDSTVLITGATGTGKTFLARKIHETGKRRNRPFIGINLASLYEGTLESELFGHERGAFTGADLKRVGRLEMAQGGTVFLDEVGELRPHLQARLLEFLQSKVISPIGSSREIRLDVRVIAATHKNLIESVKKREFREDLFHRLRVISVPIRSLHERKEDFDVLSHSILEEFCKKLGRTILRFSPEVQEVFKVYSWPGNIRELRNVLEYAVLATEGEVIFSEHLPSWLFHDFQQEVPKAQESLLLVGRLGQAAHERSELGHIHIPLSFDYAQTRKNFEKTYLQRALLRNAGRINQTARQIGLNKSTLIRKIRAFGLNQDLFVGH
jgi:DNA-binding NtrC family response regulator